MSLVIQESYVNATEGYRIGDTGPYVTRYDQLGPLYRSLQAEYGRCVGKVYIDPPGAPAMPIGWVFQGRDPYDGGPGTYLRETWVSVVGATAADEDDWPQPYPQFRCY